MGRSKDTDRRARAWTAEGCRSVAASVVRLAVARQPDDQHRSGLLADRLRVVRDQPVPAQVGPVDRPDRQRDGPEPRQANPEVSGIAPDGYVAGDDAAAKQTVLDVVESIGFRPVDAGSLASARTLEGMAWLNIQRNLAGGTWQDAWVLVGPETVAAADADSRN